MSVWVEILNACDFHDFVPSRSTWACELKLAPSFRWPAFFCHAPRERVSWNSDQRPLRRFHLVTLHVSVWVEIQTAKSGWLSAAVTLHVSVWVEIPASFVSCFNAWSRSTWACELKWLVIKINIMIYSHAPRERVSWNSICSHKCKATPSVTLHVSVWVEIVYRQVENLL